jgi:hypothetical protein
MSNKEQQTGKGNGLDEVETHPRLARYATRDSFTAP